MLFPFYPCSCCTPRPYCYFTFAAAFSSFLPRYFIAVCTTHTAVSPRSLYCTAAHAHSGSRLYLSAFLFMFVCTTWFVRVCLLLYLTRTRLAFLPFPYDPLCPFSSLVCSLRHVPFLVYYLAFHFSVLTSCSSFTALPFAVYYTAFYSFADSAAATLRSPRPLTRGSSFDFYTSRCYTYRLPLVPFPFAFLLRFLLLRCGYDFPSRSLADILRCAHLRAHFRAYSTTFTAFAHFAVYRTALILHYAFGLRVCYRLVHRSDAVCWQLAHARAACATAARARRVPACHRFFWFAVRARAFFVLVRWLRSAAFCHHRIARSFCTLLLYSPTRSSPTSFAPHRSAR